ncbi:MAG: sugar phosphate isomerase/epimerase family protein [Alphaproteobacteria bacterium]
MSLFERIGIDLGRKLSTEDGIAWAAANNVHHVDSQIDVAPNALATMLERAPAIRAAAEHHGISLALHTLSAVNIAEISPFMSEAVDQYLRTYMDVAVAAGASWIVVHAGYHFTDDYEIRRSASLKRLKRAADYAEKVGATLLLENMNREPDDAEVKYLGTTIEECQYYFANLQSEHLRWSFTANHAHLWPEGIDGFLDALDLGRCSEVRLADCRGHVEEHLQPGDGTIDFGAMFKRIEGMGFEGYYTNAFGSLDDMLRGREFLVAAAEAAGAA